MMTAILANPRVDRRDLDALIGLLQWVLQLNSTLKPWLSSLYDDLQLHTRLGTSFSIPLEMWADLKTCLGEDLYFQKPPPGTEIPIGGKLLSVKRVDIARLSNLLHIRLSSKRIWMRVTDPADNRRKLCGLSKTFLRFLLQWCKAPFLNRPLRRQELLQPLEFAADAMAKGDCIGIGGFLRFSDSPAIWFSEQFSLSTWRNLGLSLPDDASRAITCWETLAQIGQVVLAATSVPSGRLSVTIRSWSDNTGAESTSNKLFTTKKPLCYFAQRLAMLSWADFH